MSGFGWWVVAGGSRVNVPPPVVSQLVMDGLYGSWLMSEGSGTTIASEGGVTRPLNLIAGGTALPVWDGGGVKFNADASQIQRPHEAAMEFASGVTMTVGYRLNGQSTQGNLVLNYASNAGYALRVNANNGPMLVSTGNGTTGVGTNIRANTVSTETGVICVSVTPGGLISANFNGNELVSKQATVPMIPATTANLMLGYNIKGWIYYAAIHGAVLTVEQRAQMVAYAQSVMQGKGIVV